MLEKMLEKMLQRMIIGRIIDEIYAGLLLRTFSNHEQEFRTQ
jgi:hypothetical protein